MNFCEKCGVYHWPISYYENWLARYPKPGHPGFERQKKGWRETIDRHETLDKKRKEV